MQSLCAYMYSTIYSWPSVLPTTSTLGSAPFICLLLFFWNAAFRYLYKVASISVIVSGWDLPSNAAQASNGIDKFNHFFKKLQNNYLLAIKFRNGESLIGVRLSLPASEYWFRISRENSLLSLRSPPGTLKLRACREKLKNTFLCYSNDK